MASLETPNIMGKVFDSIDDKLAAWVAKQRIFFVATAPLSAEGHVNCSPKGGDTFRILNGHEVAYLDLTGSGIETVAHVQENGRIVIMFCAFEGPPRIVRLHGKATIHYPNEPAFAELAGHFADHAGTRTIVKIRVTRISDSCGYAVPLYQFVEDRRVLDDWVERKGPQGVAEYQRTRNAHSIDGLSGLTP